MKFSEQVAENKRIVAENQKKKSAEYVQIAQVEARQAMHEMRAAASNGWPQYTKYIDVSHLDKSEQNELLNMIRVEYPDESSYVALSEFVSMIRSGKAYLTIGGTLVFKY